jgi:hypothetical protein
MTQLRLAAICLLGIAVAACGSGSGTPTTPTTPIPTTPDAPAPQPPPASGITGTAIDALSDRSLPGVTVRIDGLGETRTATDGTFSFSAADPEQVKTVTLSSSATIERQTHLRVPGPSTTLSLIPSSINLPAFDQMFRPGGILRRWTGAPPVVIQTRVLQFTSTGDSQYTATAGVMSDADVSDLVADLTWALPQLTGNTFNEFSNVRIETAGEGDRVSVQRPGSIIVARYEGLTQGTTFWGYTRWAWNTAGEMQAGIVMLDRAFEESGSTFRRSLRAHELGHALGYQHVSGVTSVMNSSARIEPNAFDRSGARLAFQRPPLNRTPDVDPAPFTSNLHSEIVWHKGMH